MSLLFRSNARAWSLPESMTGRRLGSLGGDPVSSSRALRHSAVWAARRLRADLISTMPVDVYRKVSGGRRVEIATPAVLVSPDGSNDITEWLYSSQDSLDTYGNVYGHITGRDQFNLPSRIELLPTEQVTVRVRKGRVESYTVSGERLEPEDVWHERQFTVAGSPVGLSPLAHAAVSLSGYLSAQEFTQQWFSKGGVPAAHLKNTAKTLNASESQEVKSRFQASISNGDTFVSGSDWDYSMISVKANEAMFIDAMKFGIGDAARFFGVPGDMIDAEVSSGSITYANVTQRNLQLLIVNIGPAITRRERALSRLLPQPRFVKLNTGALLRMDLKSRYESHRIATGGRPFVAPSEIRAIEDMQAFTPEQLAELETISPKAISTTEGVSNEQPTE